MDRDMLPYAVSLTLGDHAAEYDITAIVDDLQRNHGVALSVDEVDHDTYWAVVASHAWTQD